MSPSMPGWRASRGPASARTRWEAPGLALGGDLALLRVSSSLCLGEHTLKGLGSAGNGRVARSLGTHLSPSLCLQSQPVRWWPVREVPRRQNGWKPASVLRRRSRRARAGLAVSPGRLIFAAGAGGACRAVSGPVGGQCSADRLARSSGFGQGVGWGAGGSRRGWFGGHSLGISWLRLPQAVHP